MHRLRILRHRLATLAVATAAHLRERARTMEPRLRELPLLREFAPAPAKKPPAPAPRPVAVIRDDPEQTAAAALRDACAALRRADPAATEAQLFTRLRLLVNRLEHGGAPRR